jgi:glycine dehydrogenase subunit 1
MSKKRPIVYPYIPNSVPDIKQELLQAVNASSIEEFYEDIPDKLRLKRKLDLPEPFLSEYGLKRYVEGILGKNITSKEYINFKGAGCFQHHVPAICDEINSRSEFLTAYAGEPYDDLGRFQALFEYASMMGELLEMDVVNVPTYDGYQAAATSIRMAARMTGRKEALVCASISPDKLSMIKGYCKPDVMIRLVDFDAVSGQMDIDKLREALSADVAAIYFENPSYLGIIEAQGTEIAKLAHENGSECIVDVDPISLGILEPPVNYGADIVCGDLQPLGMHMQFGGGQAGFIATRDEERYVMESPSRLFGIAPTIVKGEYGFGDVAYERTSFAVREQGKEWVGTAAGLWGITAGVYLALMGPQGMSEIGEGIMQRSHYAAQRIAELPGVKAPVFQSAYFKEFIVNFDETGKSVAEINAALLEQDIFGGKDLTAEFPDLGNSMLLCITEVHTKADIDQLVAALEETIND